MAPKEEPAAKKAKVEEEPKKEEEPKFQEPDAPADSRGAVKSNITFDVADTTLNVVPTVGGKVLASITDGGMAYLLAGARANTAQKAGRYMFEAKIIQNTDISYGQNKLSRMGVRIGFSTSAASLVLNEDANSFYFDSEGAFQAGKKTKNFKGGRFNKDQVVAVVLNLDSKSPNANTVALYRDGVSCGEAQKLPEEFHGKALFPHISYRNATVHVNFGAALKELPFKCRTLQSAAAADVEVSASKPPKDGKYEVAVPVAFPDEGGFDWLDGFLEKNPSFVELSDRKIVEWAKASGFHQGKGGKDNWNSNDKPAANFGVKELDDMSVRRVISAVAPVVPRNYLIMEVKSNLVAAERKETLKKFNYPCYKKVARVIMGEPTTEFKATVHTKLLKEKQRKADNAWNAKKAEAARKKAQAKQQKEAAKRKKDVEKKRKALAEEKKKEEEAKKAAEEKKEGDEEKKEEEKKADDPVSEDEKEEPEEPEMGDSPAVELTDEEKSVNFVPNRVHDLTRTVMTATFATFSTPDKEEGFDEVKYEWDKADKAKQYLEKWILGKKLTTRIENIKPGEEFTAKAAEWATLSKKWQDALKAFKAAGKTPVKKVEDGEDIDIFSVEDVCDVGDGVPLFDNFGFEDFELLKLRFELSALVISFKKDCNDADRIGIPMEHLNFYYSKYFHKSLSHKQYGVATDKDMIALIKDTVSTKDSLLLGQHEDLDDLTVFIKLTEEHRRERQRRIDAGDETARLKITPASVAAKPEGGKSGDKSKGDGKGKDYGKDFSKGKWDKGKDKGKDKGWGKGKW